MDFSQIIEREADPDRTVVPVSVGTDRHAVIPLMS